MKKRFLGLLIVFLLCLTSAGCFNWPSGDVTGTYQNPIISGFAPDPSICTNGKGDYYLANSSFAYYPGVPIYHSKDLVHWKLISYALSGAGFELKNCGTNQGIWAPTLRYHNNKYYMIVENIAQKEVLLVVSEGDSPTAWSKPKIVGEGQAEWHNGSSPYTSGIDPDIFFDDNKVYVTRTIELKPDGVVEPVTAMECWELDLNTGAVSARREVWNGLGDTMEEGPHLYRIGDYYYILLAEDGTWDKHKVTIARRKVADGLGNSHNDWEACPNAILSNPAGLEISATGHGDLVQDHQGNWWIVFLGKRHQYLPELGRETFLAPVKWVNGWPVVNDGKPITPTMQGPLLPAYNWPAEPVRDDFNASELALAWNFVRNPKPESCSLIEKQGFVTLHGSEKNLNDKDMLAWIGKRLIDRSARIATCVDFVPQKDNEVAGLTIINTTEKKADGTNGDHVEFVVGREAGVRKVWVRLDSTEVKAKAEIGGTTPVMLQIRIEGQVGVFSYSLDQGKTWQDLYREKMNVVIGIPLFVGLYVGIYSSGNGTVSTTPAYFDWFDYEGLKEVSSSPLPSIVPSVEPPPSPVERSAFERIEAESFNEQSGIKTETCKDVDGVQNIGYIENGDWVKYGLLNFGEGASKFEIRVASQAKEAGTIELRLGSPTGTLIGTCVVEITGGWQKWATVSGEVSNLSGVKDLYLVFKGGAGSLMNLNWFKFVK